MLFSHGIYQLFYILGGKHLLLSIAIILLLGYLIGVIFEKFKIPKLVGMIVVGIVCGPFLLNIIDESILMISAEIRQIALVIILTRAGLSLDFKSLKVIGRPAVLMCFLPAVFEIIGTILVAPIILNISIFEALLLGSVLAAVSPAVVVPKMIRIKSESYGNISKVPELILAGSSTDDVFVITLFYAFLGLSQNNSFNPISFISIPISIALGILLGIVVGFILSKIFRKFNIPLTIKILITLSTSFLLLSLESLLNDFVSISSLLSIMTFGVVLLSKEKEIAKELEVGYDHIWRFFEIFLFVLVGASLNLNYAMSAGFSSLVIIVIALMFRSIGVVISLVNTRLNIKEKFFCIIAYLPKATVQASIGGIALGLGLSSGEIILSVAILSILITAPLGAFGIELSYKKLLSKDEALFND
jgi:NhaP-type Na+/H+ or K+/H+ antiporter